MYMKSVSDNFTAMIHIKDAVATLKDSSFSDNALFWIN